MSCSSLEIEHEDKKVITELGVFNDGNVRGYSFHPPKEYKSTKQAFWCTGSFHGLMLNNGCLDDSELPNILLRDVKS